MALPQVRKLLGKCGILVDDAMVNEIITASDQNGDGERQSQGDGDAREERG